MSIILMLFWLLPLNTPLCDWHHSSSHSGSLDPETQAITDASAVALGIISISSLSMLVVGGPLILSFTRRVRHLFWVIPAINLILYIVTIIARPYPGGFWARFHMPGLPDTVIELIFLILFSFGAATLLAVIYFVYRMIRMAANMLGNDDQPKTVILPNQSND